MWYKIRTYGNEYKEFTNLFEVIEYDNIQFDKINIQKLFVLYFLNKENITDFICK